MAKESVQDAVMDLGKLRAILKLAAGSGEESGARIPVLIGLDNDNEAVMLAARRGSPAQLRAEAIKSVQAAKLTGSIQADKAHLHVGYAFTEAGAPETLCISLAQKPPGETKLITALRRRVKPAGFTDVLFSADESIDREDEDAAANGAAAPVAPVQPSSDLGAAHSRLAELTPRIVDAAKSAAPPARAAIVKLAAEANAAVKAGDAAATGLLDRLSSLLDAASQAQAKSAGPSATADSQAEGAALMKRIPAAIAADPAAADTLKSLAAAFVGAAKSHDRDAIETALGRLRQALDGTTRQQATAGPAPIEIWRDAKEKVDAGIAGLQKAMREWPEPALQKGLAHLADKGLNGLTDKVAVGMMAAMMEAATPAGRPKALKAMENFRTFLQSPAARDVDENPFNIAVGLRRTFGEALDAIAGRIGA